MYSNKDNIDQEKVIFQDEKILDWQRYKKIRDDLFNIFNIRESWSKGEKVIFSAYWNECKSEIQIYVYGFLVHDPYTSPASLMNLSSTLFMQIILPIWLCFWMKGMVSHSAIL